MPEVERVGIGPTTSGFDIWKEPSMLLADGIVVPLFYQLNYLSRWAGSIEFLSENFCKELPMPNIMQARRRVFYLKGFL
jgi:hypothetical protein